MSFKDFLGEHHVVHAFPSSLIAANEDIFNGDPESDVINMSHWRGLLVICVKNAGAVGTAKFLAYSCDNVTPDTQTAAVRFNDFCMTWEAHVGGPGLDGGGGHGAEFIGSNGWLIVDRDKCQVHGKEEKTIVRHGEDPIAAHVRNLLDFIPTGGKPHSDIESMAKTTVVCHLINLAYRTGKTIHRNPADGIPNDGDRDVMACGSYRREYRKPWNLPKLKRRSG